MTMTKAKTKVIRASKAGFPCARNVWYSANEYEGETKSGTQRIFDVGTALEPVIVQWLKDDGWEVRYNPGSQEAEIEYTIDTPHGQLKGHPDCWISKNGKEYLVDIKTMNERAFAQWKREGTLKSKPQYVKQLHIYAKACGATHLGIVGVNKNNSELHIDFFDFDEHIWQSIQDEAERVFLSDEPPYFNCPLERWCCSYCEFASQCEMCVKSKKKAPAEGTTETQDEDLISAMGLLAEARDLKHQAEELEKEAKAVIDDKLEELQANDVAGGGYHLVLKEVNSSRFDSTGFKKQYPELAQEFTKQSTTRRYDIERNT